MSDRKSRTPLGMRIARAAYDKIETIHATDGSTRQEVDANAVAAETGATLVEVQEVLDEIFGTAAPVPKAPPMQAEEQSAALQIEAVLGALAPHRRVTVLRLVANRFNVVIP